jgi:hypothetical protein
LIEAPDDSSAWLLDRTFTVLGPWAFLTINIDPSHFNPATGTPDSGAHIAFQNDYGTVIE